jgi:hypothetical protein
MGEKVSHYDVPIQPIDYIEANGLGFCEGNIIKYVTRYKRKDGVKDLYKAMHYLTMLIDKENGTKKEAAPKTEK